MIRKRLHGKQPSNDKRSKVEPPENVSGACTTRDECKNFTDPIYFTEGTSGGCCVSGRCIAPVSLAQAFHSRLRVDGLRTIKVPWGDRRMQTSIRESDGTMYRRDEALLDLETALEQCPEILDAELGPEFTDAELGGSLKDLIARSDARLLRQHDQYLYRGRRKADLSERDLFVGMSREKKEAWLEQRIVAFVRRAAARGDAEQRRHGKRQRTHPVLSFKILREGRTECTELDPRTECLKQHALGRPRDFKQSDWGGGVTP